MRMEEPYALRRPAERILLLTATKCAEDQTRKTTLTVYLRAKSRRFAAVALRIAPWGSLSHYLSLRIL